MIVLFIIVNAAKFADTAYCVLKDGHDVRPAKRGVRIELVVFGDQALEGVEEFQGRS